MKRKFTGCALPVVLSVALTATSVTIPVYATEDAAAVAVESVEEAPVEEQPAAETPAENLEETPAESPEETPAENPEETPAESQEETPAETPEENASEAKDAEAVEGSESVEEEPTEEEEVKVEKAMSSVTVGGVTYFYADTEGDTENTEYQASVTTGRGASAVTTVYPYTKAQLTQAGDSTIYYVVVSGTALTGTIYGYSQNAEDDGQTTTYSAVYGSLGASFDSYDTVSSATGFSSYHAKDIPSVVTFGTDGNGNKAINGLKLGKGLKAVDAEAYVTASVLKVAGKELTEEQSAMLDIKLKQNPTEAPATAQGTVSVVAASASYTSSNYGDAEFDIVPDASMSGYVWSEYWDSVYAATISDGSTTAGAVHFIDLYGEAATSGYHYNKIQLALNNGTSVASNGAEVSRFAAFYDTNTGNIKGGTYTITIYADGYTPMTASVTIPTESMQSVSVGGVTYYYADTTGDDAMTVYQVSVTTGRGPSAVTTVYNYKASDLTTVDGSGLAYIAAPGATALDGTLYGYGEGSATNYKSVYSGLGAATDDPAYDAVSSATGFSSNHAKDIAGVVSFGTDASGAKAITGLTTGRTVQTVDAKTYVEAKITEASGAELTEEQKTALAVTLKKNPTVAPATDTITVAAASATCTTSKFGDIEFDIVPDDTLSGFVWSEYWDNCYAATISNGETTVGAVHWIDMYGEEASSGYHYNKLQIALNNGTSVGSNGAEVSRYAAFYDANTGNIKGGTYTITVYSDGYTPMTATVTIPTESMQSVSVGGVTYYYADTTGDDAMTVYQVSVTTGRGPSAVTTVYNYKASDLTTVDGSGLAYIAAPGATALDGTLYGYGEGTSTNYKAVYSGLGVATDDPAYDAVSSATGFSSYHAKDIAGVVSFGTDASGAKAITGLTTGRTVQTVDAKTYVEAKITEASGAELTEEQKTALAVTLKKNPTVAPATDTITVAAASASFTTSNFGVGEFDIIPDDTLEGFVWSEYWDNCYAATISNGKTTVGAVHWIDMYGEEASSGYHYNKLQIALNNGTSVGSNAAEVSRYAAFFNKDGSIKGGTYTITIYSDGYTPMTATVTVEGSDDSEVADNSYTVTASLLNVRKGPGTNYLILGTLKHGTVVDVIETSGNWAKISYNGTEGWISTKYLEKNSSSDKKDEKEDEEDQPTTTTTYKVFASTLNVRKGAGTGYSVIGWLFYGNTVEVLETKNGWAKIAYNGSYGWISMNYLAETSSSSTPSTSNTYKITASILNVRSGAGMNYSVVGFVKKGDQVSVFDTKDGWAKISVNGSYGWVSMKYCQKQ